MSDNKYVCADCGHEQSSMDRCCDSCSGFRVVAISFCEEHIGPDWREKAFGEQKAEK